MDETIQSKTFSRILSHGPLQNLKIFCAKCKPKGRPYECAWNAIEDNTGRDDHFMDGVQHSFRDLGYRRLSRMRVSMGLTSVRSDCAVSGFVIRIVLCSATPYRNQRVERLMFRRQHKEKLRWNNTSVQPITIASIPGVDM